jgi:prophage DNA circulation protein
VGSFAVKITDIHNPWRDRLVPASFRGAEFFIDQGAKGGGRRNVLHEYPKRDLPYDEDMGRRAVRFTISAYVIGPNYLTARDRLETCLDAEGPGVFVHPSKGQMSVVCDRYSSTEVREKGGYCSFEITFLEAGLPGNSVLGIATQQVVINAAAAAALAAGVAANTATSTAPPSEGSGAP